MFLGVFVLCFRVSRAASSEGERVLDKGVYVDGSHCQLMDHIVS
jgi:hypothetical protein